MLRAFLWWLAFVVADGIATRIMGDRDGSFTWFLFRVVKVLTTVASIFCFCWFAVAFCGWAWGHM